MTFKKGEITNPHGRPRVPEIAELRNALENYKRDKKVSFIQDCVNEAKTNTEMKKTILKKILPDLSASDMNIKTLEGITIEVIKKYDKKTV